MRCLVWRGRRVEAVPLLKRVVEGALRNARHFCGPMALGARALTSRDRVEQDELMAQAVDIHAEGCVSHCYFYFYPDAIAISLERGDTTAALGYADALEAYIASELLDLIGLTVRQARALAEGDSPHAAAELEAVRRHAAALSLTCTLTGFLDRVVDFDTSAIC